MNRHLFATYDLAAAIGIAIGNTLEPVVATLLLRRLGFQGLTRVRDVVLLFTMGAAFSTTISATIGTLSLMLAGVLAPAQLQITWVSWWLGDAIADLITAQRCATYWSNPTLRTNC